MILKKKNRPRPRFVVELLFSNSRKCHGELNWKSYFLSRSSRHPHKHLIRMSSAPQNLRNPFFRSLKNRYILVYFFFYKLFLFPMPRRLIWRALLNRANTYLAQFFHLLSRNMIETNQTLVDPASWVTWHEQVVVWLWLNSVVGCDCGLWFFWSAALEWKTG